MNKLLVFQYFLEDINADVSILIKKIADLSSPHSQGRWNMIFCVFQAFPIDLVKSRV